MKKLKIEETLIYETRETPYTLGDMKRILKNKNIKLKSDDIILSQYERQDNGMLEISYYTFEVTRKRLETDVEFEIRKKRKQQEDEDRKKRREEEEKRERTLRYLEYLNLKKEFEDE